MAVKVKIKFIGREWWKGIPRKRHIDIEGRRFYNYHRFNSQLPDASYLEDVEFYERNKEVLSDQSMFVISFVNDNATIKRDELARRALLTKELADKGVKEVDGVLICPKKKCEFMSEDTNEMAWHIAGHE